MAAAVELKKFTAFYYKRIETMTDVGTYTRAAGSQRQPSFVAECRYNIDEEVEQLKGRGWHYGKHMSHQI